MSTFSIFAVIGACVGLTTAIYLVMLPRIVLRSVNRVRVALRRNALVHLIRGMPGSPSRCPIARSLGFGARVQRNAISLNLARDSEAKAKKAWSPYRSRALGAGRGLGHHISTCLFVILFDIGFYRSYREQR